MAEEKKSVMLQAYTQKELGELAQKMAQDHIDELKKIGMAYGYARNQAKADSNQRDAFRQLANKYYLRMIDGSLYEGLDVQKLRDGRYTANDLWKIAEGEYKPQQIDDVKLVQSLKDFDNLSVKDVARLATETGYDWADGKSRSEFLDKVAKFRTEAQRAENLAEWDDSLLGKLFRMVFPTASEEGRRAIATGEGGDPATIGKTMAKDAAFDVGILAAPGVSAGVAGKLKPIAAAGEAINNSLSKVTPKFVKGVTSIPEVGNIYGAAKQGAVEAGREAWQKLGGVGDREFDLSAPATVFTVGATLPSLATSISRLGGSATGTTVPSKNLADFRRGVVMTNRYGNPVAMEANEVGQGIKGVGKYNGLSELTPAQRLEQEMAEKAVQRQDALKKALEHEGKVFDPDDIEGSLKAYSGRVRYENGKPNADDMTVWENFKQFWPGRASDLEQRSKARSAGYAVGSLFNDVGGRIEPAFKPASGYVVGDLGKADNYQKTEWYKKLSDAQKKVVDDAYKGKLKLLTDEQPQ